MTKNMALEMLANAPQEGIPSRAHPGRTQREAVEIIRKFILSKTVPDPFYGLAEKRIWQVYKNQRRPDYQGG